MMGYSGVAGSKSAGKWHWPRVLIRLLPPGPSLSRTNTHHTPLHAIAGLSTLHLHGMSSELQRISGPYHDLRVSCAWEHAVGLQEINELYCSAFPRGNASLPVLLECGYKAERRSSCCLPVIHYPARGDTPALPTRRLSLHLCHHFRFTHWIQLVHAPAFFHFSTHTILLNVIHNLERVTR